MEHFTGTTMAAVRARLDELDEEERYIVGGATRSAGLDDADEERLRQIAYERAALAGHRERLEQRQRRIDEIQRTADRMLPGVPEGVPHVLHRTATESGGAARNATRAAAYSGVESREQPIKDERLIEAAVRFLDADVSGALAERVAVTGSPAYTRAFLAVVRDPARGHLGWTNEEADAWRRADQYVRANEGSISAGSALVPFVLDPSVTITGAGSISPIRQMARVVTTGSNAWHGVTAGQVSAGFFAELAESTDNSPVFAQPSVTLEMERVWIPYSLELEDDVESLATELARVMADAVDNLECEKFTNGSGTLEPKGVQYAVTANAGSRVTSTSTGAFTVDDPYKLIEALPARHQTRASWMCSLPIANRVRKFAATGAPSSAFWSDLAGDRLVPANLLGAPIYQNSAMPTTVTTGAYPFIVGDFSKLVVADHVGGAHLEIVPALLGTTNGHPIGARGAFMWKRTGSNVIDLDAFRVLLIG